MIPTAIQSLLRLSPIASVGLHIKINGARTLVLIISALVVFGCGHNHSSRDCGTNSMFRDAFAIGESDNVLHSDTAFATIIEDLDHSRYKQAIEAVKSHAKMKEVCYNGFCGVSVVAGHASFWDTYLAYRVSEFNGDLDANTLMTILASGPPAGISPDSACRYILLDIEGKYVSLFMPNDSIASASRLPEFYRYVREYPLSKRIQYLWANLLYSFGSREAGVDSLKRLLRSKYYQIPILKKLCAYYVDKSVDSLQYFSSAMNQIDPEVCNVGEISLLLESKKYDAVESRCRECMVSTSMKDSMRARLLLGRSFLDNKKFPALQQLFDEYQSANPEYISDPFKTWESGEFQDLYLRMLFVQRRYRDLKSYAMSRVTHIGKFQIKIEADLRNVLKQYYTEYFGANKSPDFQLIYERDFELFYQKNFK